MLTVDEAQHKLFDKIPTAGVETISIDDAFGRSLAMDIHSDVTQPASDLSAMDGYAVKHVDTLTLPAKLTVIGEAPAGKAFKGCIQPGEAVRIFTGGVIPAGADTIVIQENTRTSDEHPNMVFIIDPTPKGKNIRHAGLDFATGDLLQQKGQPLGARNIALLAAANISKVSVFKRPTIAIISTGDELVKPGEAKDNSQVINSNTPMLKSLLQANGANVIDFGIVKDNPDTLQEVLKKANDAADYLITIGGASVGKYDLVQSSLNELGFELDFWKVAMRPGKPVMFGLLNHKPVFGLPGNPVSAYVAAFLFVLPAIKHSLSHPQPIPDKQNAQLSEPLDDNGPRQSYVRATTWVDNAGIRRVQPLRLQDSSAITSLVAANCFIIRPPHDTRKQPDQLVRILPIHLQ